MPSTKSAGRVFVLLGRGGAGKTEAGRVVAKELGLPLLELGNIIRTFAAADDPLAKRVVDEFIAQGKYFPGAYSIEFLRRTLDASPARFKNGFVLDGFPRKTADIQPFEEFLASHHQAVNGILELSIPQQVSARRQLQRKRESDSAVVRSREQEFMYNERAVLEAYRKRNLVVTIGMRVHGRKRRLPQHPAKAPYELENARFLRKKGA